jgi:membrane-bound lytic murein transglycosylase B
MLHRRVTLALLGAALLPGPAALAQHLKAPKAQQPQRPAQPRREPTPFELFLAGVGEEARKAGVGQHVLQAAFQGLSPNARVLELDGRQPEFTLTWEQYRDRVVPPARVELGRRHFRDNRALLDAISTRFGVAPQLPIAIWGMETNFGSNTGGFGVIEALATLAYDGRRKEFFRRELISALKILNANHVPLSHMKGSWAGAMGQPQFMPTSFERFAVDFDGDGRRNIWDSRADALASIANYLAKSGWRWGEPWAREVVLPGGFDIEQTGREKRRPVQEWLNAGVRALDGTALPATEAAVLLPDAPNGPSNQAFMVFNNFNAIRRYNPSNFYALAVGLLAEAVG